MEGKIYKFTGQGLFYMAAVVCFFTIMLAPLGVFFIIAARKAHIRFEQGDFVYRMFTTKRIPLSEIAKIRIARPVSADYKVGYSIISFATVLPLIIEQRNGKKIKLSLNFFQNSAEIAEKLQKDSGVTIEMEE